MKCYLEFFLHFFFIITEFCMTTREQASPVQNTPCIFPFTYKDVEYNNCTDIDHNAYWCATGVDNEGKLITGKWGNCGAFCVHGKYKTLILFYHHSTHELGNFDL